MAPQVLSEVTEDNLIDLGPGSPAVVSPMVGNTAPAATLSTQLAGLGECVFLFLSSRWWARKGMNTHYKGTWEVCVTIGDWNCTPPYPKPRGYVMQMG